MTPETVPVEMPVIRSAEGDTYAGCPMCQNESGDKCAALIVVSTGFGDRGSSRVRATKRACAFEAEISDHYYWAVPVRNCPIAMALPEGKR